MCYAEFLQELLRKSQHFVVGTHIAAYLCIRVYINIYMYLCSLAPLGADRP